MEEEGGLGLGSLEVIPGTRFQVYPLLWETAGEGDGTREGEAKGPLSLSCLHRGCPVGGATHLAFPSPRDRASGAKQTALSVTG